jgi:uncharacterized protein YjbI with pentapeptide repeats
VANQEHLSILSDGVAHWNDYRRDHLEIVPDFEQLANADLERTAVWDSNLRRVNLSTVDFRGAKLQGVRLERASLFNADLTRADLRGAHLESSDLRGSILIESKLGGAFLSGAQLEKAELHRADLFNADLQQARGDGADFSDTNLSHATLNGTNFSDANVSNARVSSVKYSRRAMRGNYNGTLGVDSLLGNPLFRRDAADQVYIDAVQTACALSRPAIQRFKGEAKGTWILRVVLRVVGRFLFGLWGVLDYGRSLSRIGLIALFLVFGFAGVFQSKQDWFHWPELSNQTQKPSVAPQVDQRLRSSLKAGSARSEPADAQPPLSWGAPEPTREQGFLYFSIVTFTTYGYADAQPPLSWGASEPTREQGFISALYFSIVTFTTLGYGDIYPTTIEGQIVVTCEVLLGYITLGLLLAVLANTVARRS